MQVFFILFSVHFAVYQYINSKCLYRTHVLLGYLAANIEQIPTPSAVKKSVPK